VILAVALALSLAQSPWLSGVSLRVDWDCGLVEAWVLPGSSEVRLCRGLWEMGGPYLAFAVAHEAAQLAARWAGRDAAAAGCALLHGALMAQPEAWWLRARVSALGCPVLRISM
jgi:hypothetical protein